MKGSCPDPAMESWLCISGKSDCPFLLERAPPGSYCARASPEKNDIFSNLLRAKVFQDFLPPEQNNLSL